jgi:hypothetical protein
MRCIISLADVWPRGPAHSAHTGMRRCLNANTAVTAPALLLPHGRTSLLHTRSAHHLDSTARDYRTFFLAWMVNTAASAAITPAVTTVDTTAHRSLLRSTLFRGETCFCG